MKIDLSGKVALVTASTAGIGFAIAKGLAASGAEVVVNGRSERSVNEAIARLQNEVPGARPRAAVADLSGGEGVAQLLTRVRDCEEYTYVLLLLEEGAPVSAALVEGADAVLTRPFLPAALEAHLLAGRRLVLAQRRLMAQRDAFQQEALRDPLTGLYNRSAILELLERTER